MSLQITSGFNRIQSMALGDRISKKDLSACMKELRSVKNTANTSMGITDLENLRASVKSSLDKASCILNGQGSKILKSKLSKLSNIEKKSMSMLKKQENSAIQNDKVKTKNLETKIRSLETDIVNANANVAINAKGVKSDMALLSKIQNQLTTLLASRDTKTVDTIETKIKQNYPNVLAKLPPDFLNSVKRGETEPSSIHGEYSPVRYRVDDKFLINNFGYDKKLLEGRYGDDRYVKVPNSEGLEFKDALRSLCPNTYKSDVNALKESTTKISERIFERTNRIEHYKQQVSELTAERDKLVGH